MNRYFENCNTLVGVKDEGVIAYYKKGVTNIKLFENIHEADAHTIADLMAYIDKLVDTQDAVMHDFNGKDHDDGEIGLASNPVKPIWQIHQDLPPSSRVTLTWSWATNVSSTAMPNIP
jgi:hypothetical protein